MPPHGEMLIGFNAREMKSRENLSPRSRVAERGTDLSPRSRAAERGMDRN